MNNKGENSIELDIRYYYLSYLPLYNVKTIFKRLPKVL